MPRMRKVEDIRPLFPWKNDSVLISSDYEDEVSDADLERLREHIRANFGPIPEDAVVIDGPAW